MDGGQEPGNAPLAPEDANAPDHAGENYVRVLDHLHRALTPATYLEIGTNTGHSLSVARCAAIAIDPALRIETNVFEGKPVCHLYQTTSDRFFAEHDPAAIFGRPVDLAFLDGMHWFEYLLRDFINVERHCRANSVLAIHDCIPTGLYAGRREQRDQTGREQSTHPEWWAGDVWKVVPVLKRHRPDLRIMALNAGPTGLILVTRLDPASTVLRDNYFEIVDEVTPMTLQQIGLRRFLDELKIQPTSVLHGSGIARHFWL